MNVNRTFHFFIAIYVILSAMTVYSRELSVKNVRFEDRGRVIFIRYDLDGQLDKKYKISLALSDDNGKSFQIMPESVKGHIGTDIKPGKDKRITWYVKKDYPEILWLDVYWIYVGQRMRKNQQYFKLQSWGVVR